MLVSFLVLHEGSDTSVSVHETQQAAWARLVDFVERATVSTQKRTDQLPVEQSERVRLFFESNPQMFYAIGLADTTSLEDSVDPSQGPQAVG